MNLPRLPLGVLRAPLYLIGGVLPALVLAILSLLLLIGNTYWGWLLSASAWSGTIGLLLALTCPPERYDPRRTLFTCTLLMMGLVAIFPLLVGMLKGLGAVSGQPMLSLIIAGPALIAVHYLYRALLILNTQERRTAGLICLLVVGLPGLLYWAKPSPPGQIIHATAQTDEITLIVEQDAPELSPSMGLPYASKLPYRAIHYQNRTYKPLPAQARVSVPWDGTSSRYVVKESLRTNPRSSEWPHQVIWTVHDQQSGQLLAERVLWRRGLSEWSKDTPSGWQGDHAADFIRSVLKPAAPSPNKRVYPNSSFRLEETPATDFITLGAMENRVVGCSAGIELIHDKLRQHLQSTTPDWRFEGYHPIRQVFCIDADIYVISQLLAQDVFIDHLDTQGNLKGQFSASGPRGLHHDGIRVGHVLSMRVDPDELHLRLAFLKDLPQAGAPVLANRQVTLHIATHASPDTPWTSNN